jgi:manganese/zinc/iron transport system ATP- binding protein
VQSGEGLLIRDVSAGYGRTIAVREVSAAVPRGAVVGVIGPNGAGKSTLLKAVAGVLPLRTGSISLGGAEIARSRGRVAFVPQREQVNWEFPVTARDVVLMGRYRAAGWLRWPNRSDRGLAEAALERLDMGGMGGRHISQLSGGQQQRIFLARALVQDPEVVILDEPFTGIDAPNRRVFHTVIRELAAGGAIVLVATHDLEEVRGTTDYVLCVNRRMVAFGPTASTFTPEVLRETFGGRVVVFA